LSCGEQFVSVGLSTGIIFLLEQHSGLIVDSFKAHEREVTKVVPFRSPHQIMSCSFDTRNSALGAMNLWNTSFVPSRLEKTFSVPVKNEYTSTIVVQQEKNPLAHLPVAGSDNFTGMDVNVEFEEIVAVTKNCICHVTFEQMMIEQEDKKVVFNDVFKVKGNSGSFTDVRLLPLHKLVLATTDEGVVQLYS
jgi:hypothetical protein